MSEKKRIPEIRFNGFEDEWEEKRLGDEVIRKKSYPISRNKETKDTTGFKYIHYGDIHTNVASFVNDKSNIPNIQIGKYEVLEEGDIVLADASEDYVGLCKPCIIQEHSYKLASGLHTIALDVKENSPLFYYYLFYSKEFKKYISKVGTGIKVFGITNDNLMNYTFNLPGQKEQKDIGNLLKKFDDIILLIENNIKDLQSYKQSMLQKMFPKEGEKVPEIRFEGFEGEWEAVKLGQCFDERTERSSQGELISVTLNDGVKRFSELDKVDNSSEDKSNYKTVRVGDIAYNSLRMWQGACGYSNYNGILSPAYTVLIPKDNIDSMFFSYLFKMRSIINKFVSFSEGITRDQWTLKYANFKNINVNVPCFDEQKLISNFLEKLDNKINIEIKRINLYINLKKSLLDKMFV